MTPDSALKCLSLAKSFGDVVVLRGVSIDLPPGRTTALVGPNGAGKTTLLNIISGIEKPDSGSVVYGSVTISGLPPYRIARLGIGRTFQDLRLSPDMSAIDNVLLGVPSERVEHLLDVFRRLTSLRRIRCARDIALGHLEFVGLASVASKPAGILSYGQQKLLSIACCLALEARLLLLDEPLSGVHPAKAAEIRDVISRLVESGTTVLFVEHDMAVVRALADHLIVLHEGIVIGDGVPTEVLAQRAIVEAYAGRATSTGT